MDYTIEAKPTTYGGIRFRSRLEARWAAMFDLLGWDYTYEPLDLGSWSPDFLLRGACTVLAEVKPILEFDEAVADRMQENLSRYVRTVGMAGWCEPLLLGACPFVKDGYYSGMGWCCQDNSWWGLAVPGIWTDRNPEGIFGYCHADGTFNDRLTGGYDGGSHGGDDYERHLRAFRALWAEAGNLTQWHCRREGAR